MFCKGKGKSFPNQCIKTQEAQMWNQAQGPQQQWQQGPQQQWQPHQGPQQQWQPHQRPPYEPQQWHSSPDQELFQCPVLKGKGNGKGKGKGNDKGNGKGNGKGKSGNYFSCLPLDMIGPLTTHHVFIPPVPLYLLAAACASNKEFGRDMINQIADIHALVHRSNTITKKDQLRMINGVIRQITKKLDEDAEKDPDGDRLIRQKVPQSSMKEIFSTEGDNEETFPEGNDEETFPEGNDEETFPEGNDEDYNPGDSWE